jgi:hypothetical protein
MTVAKVSDAMHGVTYLVVTYAVLWLGMLAYLGWIALRLRGVRTEVEAVRDLVAERERDGAGGSGDERIGRS